MNGFQQLKTDISLEDASGIFKAVAPRIDAQLAQKGFITATAPPMMQGQNGQPMPYNGYVPPDLTQLDDNTLGWYLGMISAWLDYVQQQLAASYRDMTTSTAQLEFVNAHLLMIHKREGEKKRPEPERKAMVLIDRRYVEAQAEAIYFETYYRCVKAIATAAEQNYAAISRRISQRQQDIERQKRTTGIGNIGGSYFKQP